MDLGNAYDPPDIGMANNYEVFPEEYFSGANVSIYFGKVWIDDIQSLSFSLRENVQPIYGYASYVPDVFAKGTRLVQGQFTINFRESMYLKTVLKQIETNQKSSSPSAPAEYTFYNNLGNSSNTLEELYASMSKLKKETIDAACQAYQDKAWGTKATSGYYDGRIVTTDPHDSWFASKRMTPGLHEYGFNIIVTYGNYHRTPSATNTTHTIVGAHLTDVAQIIGPSGEVIMEQYSFIARDLDGFAIMSTATKKK